MTSTPSTRITGALAAIVAVAGLAGCGSTSAPTPAPAPSPAPTSTPRSPAPVIDPAVTQVDRSDPTAVSRTVLNIAHSIDTTRHNSFSDALAEAAPLLTDAYATDVRTAPTTGSGATWRTWEAHNATTRVTLKPSPEKTPPDTAGSAYRAWILTRTPVGADGWHGQPQQLIAMVTLTHTPGGWAVAQINYR